MPRHVTTPGAIVAVVGEDDRFATAWQLGVQLATDRHQPLILYDWDAPSLLGEPLPTWWSAETANEPPDRLAAPDLEKAGRPKIAEQVRRARRQGLEAFGWLPSDHGPEPLADYVNGQGASTVVIPGDLEELKGLDALINGSSKPAEVLEDEAAAEVVVA